MRRNAFGCLIFSTALGVLLACSTSPTGVEDGGAPDAARDTTRPDVDTRDAREDSDEIPCGPRIVLQTICQQCHTRPPKNGAPFPLIHRSDLFAKRPEGLVRDMMIEQLEARRMPLAPVTIDDESRSVLVAWLKEGAPAVPAQICTDAGPEDADVPDSAPDAEGDADADDAM